MRLILTLFLLAILLTATASIGMAVWTGHLGRHDPVARPIHYGTNYDISAQRRLRSEPGH
jgi:hypothetical protein